ncbi:MAG: prolyl oligopeptidase family serine peptidase [Caldilineaceae bacterium]
MTATDTQQNASQLLHIPYHSTATGEERDFLLYLPAGYDADQSRRWPVLFFLHGGGERGDGKADLDYVLVHGPLAEAWIRHHDLPFVIIGPQLPTFNMNHQAAALAGAPKPVRLPTLPAPPPEDRPPRPMQRAADPEPALFGVTEAWGDEGFPGGWQLCQDDLIAILDGVLQSYRTDPDRVYLTGLSYGGHGTWHMAATFPERWAAIAPFCGDANEAQMAAIARQGLPVWMFQGGRDRVVKPEWAYDLANALERAGHPSVRFTVHEDLGHDCWTRVYAGQDLYSWLLEQSK